MPVFGVESQSPNFNLAFVCGSVIFSSLSPYIFLKAGSGFDKYVVRTTFRCSGNSTGSFFLSKTNCHLHQWSPLFPVSSIFPGVPNSANRKRIRVPRTSIALGSQSGASSTKTLVYSREPSRLNSGSPGLY